MLAVLSLLLLLSGAIWARDNDPENFLAPRGSRILRSKRSHGPSSRINEAIWRAVYIQRGLARYYAESHKASICEERAKASEAALKPKEQMRGPSSPDHAV
jgi:hypothetical protein